MAFKRSLKKHNPAGEEKHPRGCPTVKSLERKTPPGWWGMCYYGKPPPKGRG